MVKRNTEIARRERWEDTVCGFLRRRFGIYPLELDQALEELHHAGSSAWDAADAIGRRFDLVELQSWKERQR